MRFSNPLPHVRPCLIALAIASVTAAATSDAGTLGRGLNQLVALSDAGSTQLPKAMKLHLTSPSGEVLVNARLQNNVPVGETLARLKAAGFRLTAISQMDGNLVEGYVALTDARAIAGTAGVVRMLAVQRPLANAGAVQSQAVAVQKADLARARGIDGTGVKVGVLSDSFATIADSPNADDDVASGDLPVVTVLDDLPVGLGTDEGRAMCQLVHDVAPGAQLGFASASKGMISFSNNILDLRRNYNADVIVDDVIYFAEPMFSDGLLAQTVDKVVDEGATYFSSAGNNGLSAYEARFQRLSFSDAKARVAAGKDNVDLAELDALGIAPSSVHLFRNADGSTSVAQKVTSYFGGDIIDFQWDEPFDLGKVQTDYNLFFFDAAGNYIDPTDPNVPLFVSNDDNVNDSDEAVEIAQLGGPGVYQVVVGKMNDGPARRIKQVVFDGAGNTDTFTPTIFGHAAARKGQAVAGMYYGLTDRPEGFSSAGPTTILFNKAGDRLDETDVRKVPQITGIDGVDTTFFGFDVDGTGAPNFFGTSAAAPNVAGVAALVIQARGGPAHSKPRQVLDRLQDTATPVPLSIDRTKAVAFSGPLLALAVGDFPRANSFWQLTLLPIGKRTVSNIAINLTTPGMLWSNPLSPTTGFKVGKTRGLLAGDVSVVRSIDRTTLTLTFVPGTFAGGDALNFANFAFPSALPFQFPVLADATRGGTVTVTYNDGSTSTGTFATAPKVKRNAFTGAGLVNADAATRGGDKD